MFVLNLHILVISINVLHIHTTSMCISNSWTITHLSCASPFSHNPLLQYLAMCCWLSLYSDITVSFHELSCPVPLLMSDSHTLLVPFLEWIIPMVWIFPQLKNIHYSFIAYFCLYHHIFISLLIYRLPTNKRSLCSPL